MEVKDIKLTMIELSEFNARKDLAAGTEDTGIDDLANSINEKGLLSPVTVRRNDNGTFSLVAGQRRYLACKRLGWETIPAIIRDIADDTDATIISLIENVHRADMNPIDKARAYQKIYLKYGEHAIVAKETGVSTSTVRKYLSLLNLAPTIQNRISTVDGPAGIGTLSKIAHTFSPEEQESVLDKIGGFKQQIQLEMIKRSDGDLSKLDTLKTEAMEGAFDMHVCRGLVSCSFIPEELIDPIKHAIKEFENKGNIESLKDVVKKLKR